LERRRSKKAAGGTLGGENRQPTGQRGLLFDTAVEDGASCRP
jgi:hypothetical protein